MVEGLDQIKDIDLKKFTKIVKKTFCCNGSIKESTDGENVKFLQFQGDHRDNIKTLLLDKYNLSESSILVHGF